MQHFTNKNSIHVHKARLLGPHFCSNEWVLVWWPTLLPGKFTQVPCPLRYPFYLYGNENGLNFLLTSLKWTKQLPFSLFVSCIKHKS